MYRKLVTHDEIIAEPTNIQTNDDIDDNKTTNNLHCQHCKHKFFSADACIQHEGNCHQYTQR